MMPFSACDILLCQGQYLRPRGAAPIEEVELLYHWLMPKYEVYQRLYCSLTVVNIPATSSTVRKYQSSTSCHPFVICRHGRILPMRPCCDFQRCRPNRRVQDAETAEAKASEIRDSVRPRSCRKI